MGRVLDNRTRNPRARGKMAEKESCPKELSYFFLRLLSIHWLGARLLGAGPDVPGSGSFPNPRAVRSC
jgi:hypothetical protein